MSQFQPDHHLRVPLQGAAADLNIQSAVRQRVPPPPRGRGDGDPRRSYLNVEMFFPETPGRGGVAIGMKVDFVFQRNPRQEALAPGEPNSEEMHVRIAKAEARTSRGFVTLSPIEADPKEEQRVGTPLLPEQPGLGLPALSPLPAVLFDLSTGKLDGLEPLG